MDSSGSSKGCMGQFSNFVRSHKGLIMAAEIVACIIILICYGASRTPGYTSLAICMLIYTIVLFIIYTCELNNQLSFIHWGWTDFIRALIGAVAFLITSLIILIGHYDGAGITAGVFGILAGILFGYDAYILLPSLKKSHTAAPTGSADGV